jgi:hypothetical protein
MFSRLITTVILCETGRWWKKSFLSTNHPSLKVCWWVLVHFGGFLVWSCVSLWYILSSEFDLIMGFCALTLFLWQLRCFIFHPCTYHCWRFFLKTMKLPVSLGDVSSGVTAQWNRSRNTTELGRVSPYSVRCHNQFLCRNRRCGINPLAERSQVTTHIRCVLLGRPDGWGGGGYGDSNNSIHPKHWRSH